MLNSPSDGRERAVSTALMLQYYGVYAPPPLEAVVSPNGDGVAETQKLSYKIVRPSTVTATLTGARRLDRVAGSGRSAPGSVRGRVPPRRRPASPAGGQPASTTPPPTAEGRWTLTVTALDDQGLSSTTTRRFAVNSTLGSLRVAPRAWWSGRRGRADIRWAQTRGAGEGDDRDPEGVVVRTVERTALAAGRAEAVTWDGRGGNRKPVGRGDAMSPG